jgi:cytoskeletal protein CcmA (bactofilin family)
MTNVGIQNNNPSSTLDVTGTLHVTGSVDFDSSLNLDGPAIFNGTMQLGGNAVFQSNLNLQGTGDFDSTLNVDGAVTMNSTVDIDGRTDINNVLEVDGATTLKNNLTVNGQTDLDGAFSVDGESIINNSIKLNNVLKDINNDDGVGAAQTDYRLSAVGSGVSWRPSGVQTKRTLWVTKNGMDSNSGLLEGDAKFTVAAAAAIAEPGDTIKIRSGVYNEANPIGLRTDVAISGEDLRLVTIVPNNPNKDVLHVRRGCLVENLSFAGASHATDHSRCGAVAFPPTENADKAISGHISLGPANEGPSGRWRSPYIRNCTNFMTGSIGMKINGDHANAAFTGINSLGQDLKSMVCDSFTQYNEAGIGVSITNDGYAQLVSIFTIGCEKGIYVDSGGQCDLTNSNSSFGIFGLVADGVGDTQFTGTVNTATVAEGDSFVLNNVKDDLNNVRKPFDGQAFFFKLDLDDYADTALGKTGITTAPLNLVRSIKITDGGSGYSQSAPPNVTITAPAGPEAILAELSANVSAAGTITSVDVIASGRNFLPTGVGANQQDVTISFSSGSATAVAEMDPIFFTVETATEPTNAGLTTVTFNEFVPYAVSAGSSSEFKRISRIITSSHSFEYIGAGTDINSSNPFQGGEPIPENEIVAINGGQVPFTSTDQKGNFRIGQGLTVDQTTSTIRGRDFNRAIQAQLTPLILALR